MSKSANLNKTWIPGTSRGTTNFNAPGNLSIPYGRYTGTITGRGGSGNSPNASAWTTNYNTVYPVGTRPVGTQPATTWTTNYNTNYYSVSEVSGFSFGHFGYSGQYPPSGSSGNSRYYQYGIHIYRRPAYPWTPPAGYGSGPSYYQAAHTQFQGPGCPSFQGYNFHFSFDDFMGPRYAWVVIHYQCTTNFAPGNPAYHTAYYTNYHTYYVFQGFSVGTQPATAWTTNYNTNYNTVYPVANRPVTGYTPGNAGAATNVLGVTFPGGPVDLSGFGGNPGTAPTVSPTAVTYNTYPDNATYPVTVPPGGQISVTLG